jgi:hypothetical protein
MRPPATLRTPAPGMARARVGDLAILVALSTTGEQADLVQVSAVDPYGRITRVRWARTLAERGPSIALRHIRGLTRVALLPAQLVDIRGALRAAEQHTWPISGLPFAPFDSLRDAAAALAPHLRYTRPPTTTPRLIAPAPARVPTYQHASAR